MELVLIIIGVAAVAYGVARTSRIKGFDTPRSRARRENRGSYSEVVKEVLEVDPVGAASRATSNSENKRGKGAKFREFAGKEMDGFAAASILGEAAWYGAEAVDNLMSVDENFYDALSHLAGKQLDTIGDLNSYLSDHWQTDWMGDLSALNNLQGHVAEFTVAEHFREMGHTVEFPEASNHPGVDMWIDGHPFNVKNVTDMSSIKEHFDKYPDIGVISNHDVDGIDTDLLSFDPSKGMDAALDLDNIEKGQHLVDMGLDHDAVLSQTDSAADAVTGNLDGHFPVITLVMSSIREIKILKKGNTDLLNSAKNIGLDVTGVGGGGFLGAQGGAALGTLLFPGVGTVIGGVVGGVVGAFFGKKGTDAIKKKPVNDAKTAYENDLGVYQNTLKSLYVSSNKAIADFRKKEQAILDSERQKSTKLIEDRRSKAIAEQQKILTLPKNEIVKLFGEIKENVANEITAVDEEMLQFGLFARLIWPQQGYHDLRELRTFLETELRNLETVEEQLLKSGLSDREMTQAAFEIAGVYKKFHDEIKIHLMRYREVRIKQQKELSELIEGEKLRLAGMRIDSFKRLREKIIGIRKNVSEGIKPHADNLKTSQDRLIAEMRKLGIEGV